MSYLRQRSEVIITILKQIDVNINPINIYT